MKNRGWSIAAILGTCLITACGGGQYSTSMDNNSTYINEGEYSGDSKNASDDIYAAEGENVTAVIILLFVIVIRIFIKINNRRNQERLQKLMNRTNIMPRKPETNVEIKSNQEEEQQK